MSTNNLQHSSSSSEEVAKETTPPIEKLFTIANAKDLFAHIKGVEDRHEAYAIIRNWTDNNIESKVFNDGTIGGVWLEVMQSCAFEMIESGSKSVASNPEQARVFSMLGAGMFWCVASMQGYEKVLGEQEGLLKVLMQTHESLQTDARNLFDSLGKLGSYVKSCKLQNTPEYLEGLFERLTEAEKVYDELEARGAK